MFGHMIGFLEALPIFRGLSKRHLGYILDVASKEYFEPGDNLLVKNATGDTAYLILTGTARCLGFPGTPAGSERIMAGCLAGEMAMLVETVHSLTVQADTRVRALAFRRDAMMCLMKRDPFIATQISDNLLARLRSFAGDLRRLDNYLAKIEQFPSRDYGNPAPPRPRAAARARAPHPPAIPVQQLLQSRR
jgi:CRP/FNR family transcriptional regulator, cyclic AMP receptor protein